jgi:hypothetical protein
MKLISTPTSRAAANLNTAKIKAGIMTELTVVVPNDTCYTSATLYVVYIN